VSSRRGEKVGGATRIQDSERVIEVEGLGQIPSIAWFCAYRLASPSELRLPEYQYSISYRPVLLPVPKCKHL